MHRRLATCLFKHLTVLSALRVVKLASLASGDKKTLDNLVDRDQEQIASALTSRAQTRPSWTREDNGLGSGCATSYSTD